MTDSKKYSSVRNSLVRELLEISDYIDTVGDISHSYNQNLLTTIKNRYKRLLEIETEFFIAQNNVMLLTYSRDERKSQEQFQTKFVNVYSDAKEKYNEIISRSIIIENFSMPKFDGRPENWTKFKINSRKMLEDYIPDNAKRLRFMKEAVSGKAAELLCPLAEKEDNYSLAWNILENYYDQIVAPSSADTSARDLKQYLDQGSTNAQNPPVINTSHYNSSAGNLGIGHPSNDRQVPIPQYFKPTSNIQPTSFGSSFGQNMPNIPPSCNQGQPTSISQNAHNQQSYLANGTPNNFNFNPTNVNNNSQLNNRNQIALPSFNQGPPSAVNNFQNQGPNNLVGRPGMPQANLMVRVQSNYFVRSGAPLVNNGQMTNNFGIRSGMPQMNIGQVQNSYSANQVPNNFQGNVVNVSNAMAGMSQVNMGHLSNQFSVRCGVNQIVGPGNSSTIPNGVTINQASLQMRTSGPFNYQFSNANARPPISNQMVNNQQRMMGSNFGWSNLPPAALALQQMCDGARQSSGIPQSINNGGTSMVPQFVRTGGNSMVPQSITTGGTSTVTNKSWLKGIVGFGSQKLTDPMNVGSPFNISGNNSATPAKYKNSAAVISLDSDSDCEVIDDPPCQKFDEDKIAWTEFKKAIISDLIKGARDDGEKLTCLRKTIPEDKHFIFANAKGYSHAISILDYYYEFSNPLRSTLNYLKSCPRIPQPRTVEHLQSFIRRARDTAKALKDFQKNGTNVDLFDGLIIDSVSNKFQKFDALWKVEKDQTCTFPDFEVFRQCIVRKCEKEHGEITKYSSSNKRLREIHTSSDDEGEVEVVELEEENSRSELLGEKKIHKGLGEIPTSKKRKTECLICSGDHQIFECSQFLDMTPASRLTSAEKLKICACCLQINCSDRPCKLKTACGKCQKNHHSLLHAEESSKKRTAGNNDKCVICGNLHEIKRCPKFLEMSWWNRMKAKDVLKICSRCVRVDCNPQLCQDKSNCVQCGSPHNSLFHPSKFSG